MQNAQTTVGGENAAPRRGRLLVPAGEIPDTTGAKGEAP